MKRILLSFFFVLISTLSFSQTLFNVDFSGSFPPAGWTIDAHSANWSVVASGNAGGTAPEARFYYSPQFTDYSRLISPEINTTGKTTVTVEFKHMLDHYSGAYTIGAATRSGGGSWNVVWEKVNPTGNIPATIETVTINNSDVGSADFQICWFFSGYSYNLDYWFLDDLKLFVPLAHDAMTKDILVEKTYPVGTGFTPQAVLKNFGLNTETFNATCVINVGGSTVYTENCSSVTLNAGDEQTVSFPGFTPTSANDLYEIIVTTNLTGDMDNTNDSRTESFNTYTTDRNMVILEIGTGTWCQYCPGAQMGGEDLVTNGHSVTVIENHNGDSFVNAYSDARNSYYGITGYPTAVFDGVEYYIGGSNTQSMYSSYLPIYQSRKEIMSAFTVDIYGEHTDLNYNIVLKLNRLAVVPADWNNLVVHFTLTETEIPFNWQGQTEVDFCQRLMVPDQNGTSVDLINNTSLDVPLQFTMNASWVTENCELAAFIQNLNTKEILQGSKVKLTELQPVPIELTSFTAEELPGKIMLRWTTASEINNQGFEVERSSDGKDFYTVGFIQGKGTTSETNNYSFVDNMNLYSAASFCYRLKQIDFNGAFSYSDVVEVTLNIPKNFALQQNYPNPFNPSTAIKYAVPQTTPVSIKLYDLTGQEVAVLVDEVKEAGTYQLTVNAKNLASGVYIYRMIAGEFTSAKKMNVLK